MSRIPFSEEHKSLSIFDYPRLRLKKKEKSRILMIEQDSVIQYTHYVNLGENNDNNGYYTCHGIFDIMAKNGTDPNCKFCVEAAAGLPGIKSARRRFAAHIIRYRTDTAGKVIMPISVELLLWVYADDKYNNLTTKATEWGDLRKHDLLVECTAESYQKFEIEVAKEALWMADEKLKMIVVNTYKENKRSDEDLLMLLGRNLDEAQIAQFIARIKGVVPAEASAMDITGTTETPVDILGDLGGGVSGDVATPAVGAVEGVTNAGEKAVTTDEQVFDFSNLLDS